MLIAGAPSHGPGAHEHRAGSLLLQRCLGRCRISRSRSTPAAGWTTTRRSRARMPSRSTRTGGGAPDPRGRSAGDAGPADGPRRRTRADALGRGGPGDRGAPQLDRWIGAHYEDLVSCNPMWDARFERLPEHPITRGVPPFATHDEWYFNLRSGGDALAHEPTVIAGSTVSPILVATPSDTVREGPYVWPHGPYPAVVAASGRPEPCCGRSSVPTVVAASACRAATTTPTGGSTRSARRCSTRSSGWRAPRSPRAGSSPTSLPTTWPVTSTRRGDRPGPADPVTDGPGAPGCRTNEVATVNLAELDVIVRRSTADALPARSRA